MDEKKITECVAVVSTGSTADVVIAEVDEDRPLVIVGDMGGIKKRMAIGLPIHAAQGEAERLAKKLGLPKAESIIEQFGKVDKP